MKLPPAVAMQPPAPPRFRRVLPTAFALDRLFSQPVVMMVRNETDHHSVLDQARALLRDGYGIDHATFQVEPEDHHGCEDVAW